MPLLSQAAGALAHIASAPGGAAALLSTPGLVANLVKLLESPVHDVKLAATMALSAASSVGDGAGRALAKEAPLAAQLPQLLDCPHGQVQAYALVLFGNLAAGEEAARQLGSAEHVARLLAFVHPQATPAGGAGGGAGGPAGASGSHLQALPGKRLAAAGALVTDALRWVTEGDLRSCAGLHCIILRGGNLMKRRNTFLLHVALHAALGCKRATDALCWRP